MKNVAAKLAMAPTIIITVVVFVGCLLWTVAISFTSTRSLPELNFIGLGQYITLANSARWAISMRNMFIFGVVLIGASLVIGYLLAVLIDQKVRAENALRTIYLYPHALSYIVTGLAWQWFLNPQLGLQKFVRDLGWDEFSFRFLIDPSTAIYAVALAAVWHSAGLVMALMLAGLRGIDEDIWKATRVDGIPAWRTYLVVVLPMLGPTIATCTLLLAFGVIRNYDLVVAMTGGGPGNASEVPAKFVMEYLFERVNAGLASAGATVMLLTVLAVAAPIWHVNRWQNRRRLARSEA